MAIVKQTLHPEGDTGTDIYPKTSTDQIIDLPLSAALQLYAHYIYFYYKDTNVRWGGQIFFVNSISTPANSLSDIQSQIKGRAIVHGDVVYIQNAPSGLTANIKYSVRYAYLASDGNINLSGDDGVIIQKTLSELLFDDIHITFVDNPIVLGSNAD